MPSIVTHYLFSEDVYEKSSKDIHEILKNQKQIYHIFAQSFDNLFYYNLLLPKKGKEIRKLGNTAQRIHIDTYFKNIILAIKKTKMEKNPEILAYLYGSLAHYILDRNCHPFVIYHAGHFDPKKPNYKYRGKHAQIEVNIDAVLFEEKTMIPLYQAKLGHILLPKIRFSSQLKEILTTVYQQTFHVSNMAQIYEKSVRQGHYILRFFVTDHFGIKKKCYQLFDFLFFRNPQKYQNLSFYIRRKNENYLNRYHHKWCNPVDKKRISTLSFDDLYEKALIETNEIFEATNKVLHNKLSIKNYLKIIEKRSYVTGLDWQQKTELKYFK